METEERQKRKPSRLYTTKIIDALLNDIKSGYDVDMSPFFMGETELRNANITFQMTIEEQEEYFKCFNDAQYFIDNYVKFLTDSGRKLVIMRDYQKDIVKTVTAQHYDEKLDEIIPDNKRLIIMASRQVGKTTTTAAYMTWYLCFHTDRNVGIMANKLDTAKEIVDKVNNMIKGLPYFIKPGVYSFGKLGASFDNGCNLISSATTKNTSIGFTLNGILYLDEFAHIDNALCRQFWRSVYPTMASSNTAQLIITSTPNGTENLFYDIWDKSINGNNSFVNIRVDYWQVPGHDTPEWEAQTIQDFTEEAFNQEFRLQFSSSSSSFIRGSDLEFIQKISKRYEVKNLFGNSKFLEDDRIQWHPDFNPNSIGENDKFIFLVDLAEGNGDPEKENDNKEKTPDSNTIAIYKIIPNSIFNMKRFKSEGTTLQDAFKFCQVGRFSCSSEDEEYCANITSAIAFDLFHSENYDNVRVMVEMNFQGKNYLTIMQNHAQYYDDIVLRTYHIKPIPGENSQKKKPGFKTNANKEQYCKKGRKMLEKRRIIPTDLMTLNQIKSFGWVSGKLKGIASHDDLSFPTFNHIPRMMEEELFVEWIDNFLFNYNDTDKKYKINQLIERYDIDDSNMNNKDFCDFMYSAESVNINTMERPIVSYASLMKNN